MSTTRKEINDKIPKTLESKFREWTLVNKIQLTRDVMHYILEPTIRVRKCCNLLFIAVIYLYFQSVKTKFENIKEYIVIDIIF